jgi:hypothetical protein
MNSLIRANLILNPTVTLEPVRTLNIKEIIDSRFVKELEDGGFITSLYKNKLLLLKYGELKGLRDL